MATPNFSTYTCKLTTAENAIQMSIDISGFDIENQRQSALSPNMAQKVKLM